jgi:hypothetical protein
MDPNRNVPISPYLKPGPQPTPAATWQEALVTLEGQMARGTFDLWLRGSRLLAADGGTWTIGVASPQAVEWLTHRLGRTIHRTVSYFAGREVTLEYVVAPPDGAAPMSEAAPSAPAPPPMSEAAPSAPAPPPPAPALSVPTPRVDMDAWVALDPNSGENGGFWMMGHYASAFWLPLLGSVAFLVYALVARDDKRRNKTAWTPPRRYSISKLARTLATGPDGRPNRDQIRGRFRTVGGERVWRPGAFDRLTEQGVARIEWHDGDGAWWPWAPGGAGCEGRNRLRLVYRLSAVTRLPLLTPGQVARLPADFQLEHERYLANHVADPRAWEGIGRASLAGLEVGGH